MEQPFLKTTIKKSTRKSKQAFNYYFSKSATFIEKIIRSVTLAQLNATIKKILIDKNIQKLRVLNHVLTARCKLQKLLFTKQTTSSSKGHWQNIFIMSETLLYKMALYYKHPHPLISKTPYLVI